MFPLPLPLPFVATTPPFACASTQLAPAEEATLAFAPTPELLAVASRAGAVVDTSAAPTACTAPAAEAGTQLEARCGEASTLVVLAAGRDGTRLHRGGASFTAQLLAVVAGCGDVPGGSSSVRDNGDGSYTARFVPSSVGPHHLAFRLRGEHILGSPFGE